MFMPDARRFRRPPKGVTKIVVATNIAEASITIDDVTCVIDGGGHKEVRYDPRTSQTSLRLVRIAEVRAGKLLTLFWTFFHTFRSSVPPPPPHPHHVLSQPDADWCLQPDAGPDPRHQANATQRAGRAGRTRAGVCFHLYMHSERLEPQQQPEVQRSPLEPLCILDVGSCV